jgi:RimJ/RimL family protein N-acetyltransferase
MPTGPSYPRQIESARLILRAPTLADLEQLFRIESDPRTNTFNPAGPYQHLEQAETILARWLTHWHERGFGPWAISARQQAHTIIGFGGLAYSLHFGPEPKINLGYRFDTSAWGMGLGTELACTAVSFGFETLQLDEIFAKVRENHLASRRVLEKAGLQPSGRLDDVPGAAHSIVYRVGREVVRA